MTKAMAGVPGDPSTPCTLGCFHCAKSEPEPTESKLDMLGGPFSRGPEGLLESKKVAIETKAGFDVASVEMDERVL